ncbi:hypothetical protein ACOSQ3_022442 [Xanthoceras sorbifolium]
MLYLVCCLLKHLVWMISLPYFFQKHWSIVGDSVTATCLHCLNEGASLTGINHTLITLISKIKSAEKITDFGPISLCNVLYKIISKTLANRFRTVLNLVISDSQSAFIPGRVITDNALVGFECMHALKRKSNKKDGYMALKLDMSKAYDCVEWSFLVATMLRLGFSQCWVDRIMRCVTSVSYSFMLNGSVVSSIIPSRGLRQGDPLSPYLFLICAEGLSALISDANVRGVFSGFRCSRNGHLITHLFFADDSMIFTKATSTECLNIQHIILTYLRASGQSVNFQKSSVCFSKHVPDLLIEELVQILGVQEVASHKRYLGLQRFISWDKRSVFQQIKDRI